MMDLKVLVENINEGLTKMDAELAAARKAMGIRPRLEEATQHIMLLNELVSAVVVLILEAQNFYGVQQPPDVIERVNERSDELAALTHELAATRALAAAGDAKPRITSGRNAAN